MASTLSKSRGAWTRVLVQNPIYLKKPIHLPKTENIFFQSPKTQSHFNHHQQSRDFCISTAAIREIRADIEREKQKEREEKKKAGLPIPDDNNNSDDEDFLGVQPLINKLEKSKINYGNVLDMDLEEPTDDETDEDDERFTEEAIQKRAELFEKKCRRHEQLVRNFTDAETLEEAYKCMVSINKFEEKHLKIPLEYRVIGEMMNRLREATGKEKFMLQQKLHRALKVVQWKEKYDPNNRENYGIIEREIEGPSVEDVEEDEEEINLMRGVDDDDEGDFEDDKEAMLLEKLSAIDKKLEDKLALLDHTFGKKGRVLEEEIKDLADDRNALTESKTRPLYRKGFEERLINVNRTCKVTKGGQVASFTALVACGNLHGVVGFAKAKGPKVPIALQKAREKCYQNLHYVERHEEHTIAHAVQSNYKKTKVYLWPASTRTGMIAGNTVKCILKLAGFKNIKSKVIGSRNPHNTVKAVFKALNAIETPKDVQEKFGRTVVESYLL